MRYFSAILFSAFFTSPLMAASPIAEIICAPRDDMVQRLTVQYGAELSGQGIRDRESLVEVWASEERGTWSLVISYADGKSCIVAMGEHWAQMQIEEDPA